MQELIIEIAIYLGIAAFLGFLLAYLIWGMGARRRIAAARAEGAAEVRTSVDGDSSLRTQIDNITRERDRLEHRVQVLSARVATLIEGGEDAEKTEDLEKELGTVQLRIEATPDDPMDGAAAAFPRPLEEAAPEGSVFEPPAPVDLDPEGPGTANAATPEDEPRAPLVPDPETARASDNSEGAADRAGDTAADGADSQDVPESKLPLRRRPRPESDPNSGGETYGARKLFEAASSLREGAVSGNESPSPETPQTAPSEPSPDAAAAKNTSMGSADGSPENTQDDATAAKQDPPPAKATDAAPSPTDSPEAGKQDHSPPDRAQHVPAGLFSEPPETPDDLTRIKGIGKSTQKTLNSKGIWMFSQLAAMSSEDIAWLRSELGGQMARTAEKWVEQAKSL